MNSVIETIKLTGKNGEKFKFYPRTKQEAVENLVERFLNLEIPDITETTSTTQPNSHAGREMVLEIGGVMEQDSTAGNQLFDANDSEIKEGLFIQQDGVTNTSSVSSTSGYVIVAGLQNITVNGENDGNYRACCWFDENKVVIPQEVKQRVFPYTLEVPENAHYFRFSYVKDTESTIMVNAGNTALPYEQYTGGQPAPNPYYPMPIKNSKVKGIRTHHKNFLKNTATSNTVNGGTFTINEDKSITVNGTFTATTFLRIGGVVLKGNQSYILSGCPNGGSANSYLISLRNENNSSAYTNDTGSGAPYTPTADITVYPTIRIQSGTSMNHTFYPMIRKADVTDATYKPYTSSEYTFSQPIDLYGMDGVQDVITQKPIERRFAKRVFDGSESWSTSVTLTGRFLVAGLGCKSSGKVLCTQAKSGLAFNTTTINECYLSGNSNGQLVINTEFATLDEWKSHLAEKPMEVVYELAEEVTEELPIADQIGLNSLLTYDGITYVEFIYDELEPTFKGKYGTSEVGGMTLESLLTARNNELKHELANERLSALEASVVNNI